MTTGSAAELIASPPQSAYRRPFGLTVDSLDVLLRVYMRARSRIGAASIGQTFFGAKLHCATRDFIQRRIKYFGIYEPNLTYYIVDTVRRGETVIDVGANIGYMTLLLSTLVGETGKVLSIEASPETFSELERNLGLNAVRNVIARNMAATGAPCSVAINRGERDNSGTNSIRKVADGEVASIRGDALSATGDVDIGEVSFIKIDIEGSEGPVLDDILDHIDLFRNLRAIAVELSPGSDAIFDRLKRAGFRAFMLPNDYRIGYMLVREYLRRSAEHAFVVKIPLEDYEPRHRDFVFER